MLSPRVTFSQSPGKRDNSMKTAPQPFIDLSGDLLNIYDQELVSAHFPH